MSDGFLGSETEVDKLAQGRLAGKPLSEGVTLTVQVVANDTVAESVVDHPDEGSDEGDALNPDITGVGYAPTTTV